MTELKYIPGDCMTLGVTRTGKNVNFAVAVGDTDEVILKLYKGKDDISPEHIIKLDASYKYGNIFAVTLKNFSGKGYTYSYEAKGVSFIDPYAKLISGREVYGKVLSRKEKSIVRAYVNENAFDWKDDRKPGMDFQDLIIYKLHARGFTMLGGGAHKGTYRGIADKVSYLKELGINAILLMPAMEYNEIYDSEPEAGVPEFVSSKFYKGISDDSINSGIRPDDDENQYVKESMSKVNYWGYTGFYYFFAPKASYAFNPAKADYEFKYMVSKLHEAGIEILMEVSIPKATNRTMMLDALRYWVREYRIDGFKLNLDCIDSNLIACDPYLSTVKLIGSGWNTDEIYPREYIPEEKRLGVYNDSYKTDMRRFLKSDEGVTGAAIHQFADNDGKVSKINYITDHNGFTLADLYMYDMKHNEENGEKNKDGTDVNFSWNCGTEGPDNHKKIRELRTKMKKNAMAALILGQGVPLILAGDEHGNTQYGNNNAYCQDNETGWVRWKKTKSDAEFLEYVKKLIRIRKEHPVLHNRINLRGMDYLSCGIPDVSKHSNQAWIPDYSYFNRCGAVMYSGNYAMSDKDKRDSHFYIAFNMYWDEQEFELPHIPDGKKWEICLSTDNLSETFENGEVDSPVIKIPGRCILVLKESSKKAKKVKESCK